MSEELHALFDFRGFNSEDGIIRVSLAGNYSGTIQLNGKDVKYGDLIVDGDFYYVDW